MMNINLLRNNIIKELRKAKANFLNKYYWWGNAKLIWKQIKKLTGKDHKSRKHLELGLNGNLIQDP